MSKPKFDGTFVFSEIKEGESIIEFNPPLKVKYTIFDKKNPDDTENYSEDTPIMGYCTFDFGMNTTVPLDPLHNILVNGYNGLTKDSSPEDILMHSLIYDLFHSFCHPSDDPNYIPYNWAIFGNLSNRTKVIEEDASA